MSQSQHHLIHTTTGTAVSRSVPTPSICRGHHGGSRCALGCARRVQRVGRTTSADRRQRGDSLEPSRGDDARRRSGSERRCPTRILDKHGHGAGSRVRRGQRDRAEAASSISARHAHRCEGVHRRRGGNRCLRRALRARLDGTGEGAISWPCGTPEHALLRVRCVARCDRRRLVQEAGHRGGTRRGRGHARRESGRRAVRAVSVGVEPRARTLAAAPLWRRAGPRPDPLGGQREAVPHPELLAVPFGATARARQPAVGD